MRYHLFVLFVLALHTAAVSAFQVPVTYTLEKPGQVSLGIYNANGDQLRLLLCGEKQPAGQHTVNWDGLDRYGNPAAPGTYQWRLLRTDGFQAQYVSSIGTNTPVAPWDEWIGNHQEISAVVSDGKLLYLGTIGENVPGHIAVPLNGGKVLWRGGISFLLGKSYGMDLMHGLLYDLRTFRNGLCSVFAVDPANGKRKYGFDVKWPQEKDPTSRVRMSAGGGAVVVAYLDHDEIRWFNPAEQVEGMRLIATAALKNPVDVAVTATGIVYAISEGAVVTVAQDGRTQTVIPANQLSTPVRLAWVAATNELLVAERDGSHLVKRFALPAGELRKAYGVPGGQVDGPYNPTAFRNLNDVADDRHGGFFIAEGGEGALLRTAWFAADGTLKQQWFGPQQYFNFAVADPDDPTLVWINGDYGSKTLCRVDYATGQWQVVAHYAHPRFDNLLPPASGAYHQWQPRRLHGTLYFWCQNGSSLGIVRLDEHAQVLRPVAAAGTARVNEVPAPLAAALTAAKLDPTDPNNLRYLWSDVNGDGQFQPDEFLCGPKLLIPARSARKIYMDEQWNVYYQTEPRQGTVVALKMTNLAAPTAVAPRWDPTRLQQLTGAWPAELRLEGEPALRGGIWVAGDGTIYRQVALNEDPRADRPAPNWPTLGRGGSRLVKWRPDGSVEWSVGRQSHLSASDFTQPHPAGLMHEPCGILGLYNGCVIVADRSRHPATAWTTDGLYAGDFFDRRANDRLPAEVYHWWRDPKTNHDGPVPYDCLTGGSIRPLSPEALLWLPMGQQNSPAYRVTGWDGWNRLQGNLVLERLPASAAGTGTGLKAEYFTNNTVDGQPATVQVDGRLWFSQLEGKNIYRSWAKQVLPTIKPTDAFSIRWTGQVEAPLSEPFTLMVINRSQPGPTSHEAWYAYSGGVRVWLDGTLIIEQWDPQAKPGGKSVSRLTSKPILLEAGKKYNLRVEYANWGTQPAEFSLIWRNDTQELHRIPMRYLYPPTADTPQ